MLAVAAAQVGVSQGHFVRKGYRPRLRSRKCTRILPPSKRGMSFDEPSRVLEHRDLKHLESKEITINMLATSKLDLIKDAKDV